MLSDDLPFPLILLLLCFLEERLVRIPIELVVDHLLSIFLLLLSHMSTFERHLASAESRLDAVLEGQGAMLSQTVTDEYAFALQNMGSTCEILRVFPLITPSMLSHTELLSSSFACCYISIFLLHRLGQLGSHDRTSLRDNRSCVARHGTCR